MKRPIPLLGYRRSLPWAVGLAAACGLFVTPASQAQDVAPAAFARTPVPQAAASDCQVTLPGGIKATVTSGGARVTDPAAAGQTILSYRSDGDQYVVPADLAAQAGTKSLAAYDATALAQRTCGADAVTSSATAATATAGQAQPAADHGTYTMGRLTAHMIGSNGKPALSGLLFLVNTDHTTYVDQAFGFVGGTVKISVPTGHYEAVYYDVNKHLTIAPDVTVGDGTTLTLDARTSTHQIPVPTTPRPASLTNSELSLYSSDGTSTGDAAGPVLQLQSIGSAPLGFSLNTTPGVKHGRFEAVTAFDLASPAGAPAPYTYHIANTFDQLPSSYPTSVEQSSLATVDETYSAPAGKTGYDVVVNNATPKWAATAGVETLTAFDVLAPGTQRTEYFSALPDLTWRTEAEDEQTADTLYGQAVNYRPGAQLATTWEGGVPHPSTQLDNGTSVAYCGACASPDTMLFGISSDGDSTPGTVGVGFDETSTVTLSRNGTLLADGTGGLYGASVPVPAGRATYRLEQQTVRNLGTLAPSTDTTWTFTADPGKGKALPGTMRCAAPVTPCAALPLLYASLNAADADIQHQLTAGPHTVDLNVTHQQYATAGAVSGAQLQVSYDNGKSWQSVNVTGDEGSYRADFTVPADAVGGTVSFKLAAWDDQGNRIDQTLPNAYGVR